MELYLQVCAGSLVALVLVLTLGSRGKETGILLGILTCAIGATVCLRYLDPVIEFLTLLGNMSGINNAMVTTLLKITGIGILTEISSLICADAGMGSMGKTLQLVGSAVVLWLSLPLFTALIELLQSIIGEI